ncbi:RNA polymerase sigma factor [Flavitalea flava]
MMDVAIFEKLLWKKFLSGDHPSFHSLFDKYWEPLFQHGYKIVQNKEDAEEIVQELFIHLWNKRSELPELQSVSGYLFTALRNRILNQLAKKRQSGIVFEGLQTSMEGIKDEQAQASPADLLEKKSIEITIRSLAKLLPEKMQQVYISHQFTGLTIAEIASATGNSEQTIRNQFNTAVKKLSAVYKDKLHTLPLIFIFFYFI